MDLFAQKMDRTMKCVNCYYFASVGGDDECDKHTEATVCANDRPCKDFEPFGENDVVIYHFEGD